MLSFPIKWDTPAFSTNNGHPASIFDNGHAISAPTRCLESCILFLSIIRLKTQNICSFLHHTATKLQRRSMDSDPNEDSSSNEESDDDVRSTDNVE